jgi:hypothetical protein
MILPPRPENHPRPERILADAGEASALDLFACVEAGLDLSAPSRENDQTERRHSKQPQRQIPKSEFG